MFKQVALEPEIEESDTKVKEGKMSSDVPPPIKAESPKHSESGMLELDPNFDQMAQSHSFNPREGIDDFGKNVRDEFEKMFSGRSNRDDEPEPIYHS